MGTKNEPGNFDCYAKAEPDEPMFVLLARDPRASALVREWVRVHRDERLITWDETGDYPYGPNDKEREALDCAAAMDAWRARNYG